MKLVGLMGKKRAGKDTFAKTLVEEHAFTRFAFADPLKQAAYELNPFVGVGIPLPGKLAPTRPTRLREVVDLLGWEKAKAIPEVRRLLQVFGTETIRSIQDDFWIRATLDRALQHGGNVVITDVRYPNEADEIKQAGGTLIRIVRPDLVSDDTHPSETALDDYEPDVVVYNHTLDQLAEQARRIGGASWL